MDYNDRQFIIFSVTELPKIDFNEVQETSSDTVRRSVNGTKTFVKWDGNQTPTFVATLDTKEGPFSYSEILEILLTEEWAIPNPTI